MGAVHVAEVDLGARERAALSGGEFTLSVVIPAYNEAQAVPLLVEQLVPVLEGIAGAAWEVILVDDGSTDGTGEIMARIAAARPGFTAILLRGNFGKSAALMAGFREAEGDVVVTMDADLQDDPVEIPRFIEELDRGFDLVSGWKVDRRDPIEKRIPSLFFNAVVRKVSGVSLRDSNCGFKAYRKWCVKCLALRGNQHRFIPALLSWEGARIAEIPVQHHPRRFGTSKYGVARYFQGAFDLSTLILLTKFSQSPLYLFGLIGLPLFLLGAGIGGWLVVNHALFLVFGNVGFQLTSRPLLIIALFLLLMGLLVMLIGLVAEMVLRTTQPSTSHVRTIVRCERGVERHESK